MEGTRTMRAVVVMVLAIIGGATVVAGQIPTNPYFKECYIQCFVLCIIVPPYSAFTCSLQCLPPCIIPKLPLPPVATTTTTSSSSSVHHHIEMSNNTLNFCKLGCASALCSNISTKKNPGGEKVESCVGSCSGVCSKNYLSP